MTEFADAHSEMPLTQPRRAVVQQLTIVPRRQDKE